MRSEFSKRVKVDRFRHAEGRCEHVDATGHRCNKFLMSADIFYDHHIADGIGGEPTFDNCRVLCKTHHDEKTRRHDVPRIAKTKRQAERNAGIRKPSRPMDGSRNSPWKKKMDGTTEKRQ